VITEWTRRLEDGSTITIKNHRTVARDRAGRIFQERRYFTPAGDQRETALTQVEFSDPSSHAQYICIPQQRSCQLRNYFAPRGDAPVPRRDEVKIEDLGNEVIEGLDTIGTRETTTIAAAAIGSDRPIVAVKEVWFASKVGVNLVVSRVDPR